MSDYISREAMNETPKCPYCGDRMKIRVSLTTPDWGLLSAQYKCMTCESTSPRIEFSGGTSNEKIIGWVLIAPVRETCKMDFVSKYLVVMGALYGKEWRCWLRKPTEAERRGALWEGDNRE